MTRKTVVRLALLFVLASGAVLPLAAQEQGQEPQPLPTYVLGQQTLSLSAGLFIPLFYQSFDGGVAKTNLSLGGSASLEWDFHLGNHWVAGAEVGGIFSRSVAKNFLYMVPIMAKGGYIFHIFPFEIGLNLGTGMDIVKYQAQTQINFIVKPSLVPVWKYNSNWAFGLNVSYWWIPQSWSPDPELGRMGNFLDVKLTAKYTF